VHAPNTVRLSLSVNGQAAQLDVPRDAKLLHVLRNDLALNGPKYGCGLGECGACTVLVDGVAARSCVIPARGVQGRAITTLEGLGCRSSPHPIQQAFIDAQAAQCGYCLNGMIMATAALLSREPDPDDATIRRELAGNLCRCGTHLEILEAVRLAARRLLDTHRSADDAVGRAAVPAVEMGSARPDAVACGQSAAMRHGGVAAVQSTTSVADAASRFPPVS